VTSADGTLVSAREAVTAATATGGSALLGLLGSLGRPCVLTFAAAEAGAEGAMAAAEVRAAVAAGTAVAEAAAGAAVAKAAAKTPAASTGGANHAYVTLVTSDDFVVGAEVMLFSLHKTGTCKASVILVTPQVSPSAQKKLAASGACVIEVADIPNPNSNVHVEGWVNSGYTKLHIWNLTQYDKLLYLDADTIVVENVDELFEAETDFAAAPDVFPPDKFNAGVLLIKPCHGTFEDMQAKSASLPSHDGGDTGFLNSYYPDWYTSGTTNRLPFRYNAQRTLHWLTYEKNPGYWEAVKPLKIIHYSSSPKPWDADKKKGDLELIWWRMFMESKGVPSGLAGS
jgi:glycogenin glucosyltransferase